MKAFYESRNYNADLPVSAFRVRNMDFVAHWHDDIEMLYVCEGQIGVGLNSDYRILQKGEISICGSNDIHYYNSADLNSNTMVIIFRPKILNAFEYWPSNLLPRTIFIDREYWSISKAADETRENIETIFGQLIEEMAQKRDLYPSFTSLKIAEIFLTLFRCFPDYTAYCRDNNTVLRAVTDITPMQKALKYLEENYQQKVTLESISKEVNLSRFYFSRLFQKTTGMNFNNYLTRIRVQKAEALIRNSREAIVDIAYDTGFSSVRTFNRSFKSVTGRAPCNLRR